MNDPEFSPAEQEKLALFSQALADLFETIHQKKAQGEYSTPVNTQPGNQPEPQNSAGKKRTRRPNGSVK